MIVHTLATEQFISKPLDEVFHFFNRPENLEAITPKSLSFEILTPKPIQMMTGAVIDYQIRICGKTVRWTSIITDYAPPYKFVDTQIKGPYSFWHHTHTFVEKGNGTLVKDTVRYALGGWVFGKLAHKFFVRKQLEGIFSHRKEVIENIFNEEKTKTEAI